MATRQTQYADSLGEDTTTSGSDQDKVTLTFTPDASSDYFIFGAFRAGSNSASADYRAKLANTTSATTFNSLNVEQKDLTDYPTYMMCARETFGGSPASQTYKIQYSSESALATAKIKEARILALKAGSQDQYAESLGDSTTTSASFSDKVTLTFTPATTGNYTIIYAVDQNIDTTSSRTKIRIDIDGTPYCEQDITLADTTTFKTAFGVIAGVNLTNASHDIKLQYANATAGNTVTVRNAKIIALREDDFEVAQTVNVTSRETTTSTTYVDITGASLTFTPAAVEHIIFFSSLFDSSSNTQSSFNQITEAASNVVDTVEEPGTNTTHKMNFGGFYRKTLSSSSTTWKVRQHAETSNTTGTDEISIAVFQTATTAAANLVAGPMQNAMAGFIANYGGQGFIAQGIQTTETGT